MAEPGECAGLAGEAFGEGGVRSRFGWQDLDRDHAIEARLAGLVNGSHSPLA